MKLRMTLKESSRIPRTSDRQKWRQRKSWKSIKGRRKLRNRNRSREPKLSCRQLRLSIPKISETFCSPILRLEFVHKWRHGLIGKGLMSLWRRYWCISTRCVTLMGVSEKLSKVAWRHSWTILWQIIFKKLMQSLIALLFRFVWFTYVERWSYM